MADLHIDSEGIAAINRYRKGMDLPVWPVRDSLPLGPAGVMLAWLRANARDTRYLWWGIVAFGPEEIVAALNELSRHDHPKAQSAFAQASAWMRNLAMHAKTFDECETAFGVVMVKPNPTGDRTFTHVLRYALASALRSKP